MFYLPVLIQHLVHRGKAVLVEALELTWIFNIDNVFEGDVTLNLYVPSYNGKIFLFLKKKLKIKEIGVRLITGCHYVDSGALDRRSR